VTEPLTPEEEAVLRESFAAGMRQDRSATVVFAREDIARLLATLDAARSTDEGLDVERLADAYDTVVQESAFYGLTTREFAEAIAREYAALAKTEAQS